MLIYSGRCYQCSGTKLAIFITSSLSLAEQRLAGWMKSGQRQGAMNVVLIRTFSYWPATKALSRVLYTHTQKRWLTSYIMLYPPNQIQHQLHRRPFSSNLEQHRKHERKAMPNPPFTVAGMSSTSNSHHGQNAWTTSSAAGTLSNSLADSLSQSRTHYQSGYLLVCNPSLSTYSLI